jgi:sulfur carrier protein
MNADSLTILLDGKPHAVPSGTTLEALVTEVGHAAQAVSTAVNGDFVLRAQRTNRVLMDNDLVLLFQPIVGG